MYRLYRKAKGECMKKVLKFVSWNVNGIRAAVKKGFIDVFNTMDADVFCLQETKLQEGQIQLDLEGYHQYWNYAEKKGYSGTALFTKEKPIQVTYDLGVERHDHEGRIITAEFSTFYVVTCYTPNAKRGLERLEERMDWEDEVRAYLQTLEKSKAVIYCGDLNVAHEEKDLKNWKTNRMSAGFTDQEREKMSLLLDTGFVDSFRYVYPDIEKYSWFSYMGNARANKVGWRIDYFIVSSGLKEQIVDAEIYDDIQGSDHVPVELKIEI